MHTDASLRLFAYHAARPAAELDLARAALLIAEPSYPNLDLAAYLEQLDELGRVARRSVVAAGRTTIGDGAASEVPPAVTQLLGLLYGELGFSGNADDYYDPRNSFLNEVLDRRTGIPITLALVVTEVARRAGLVAQGIAFPGHFLLRFENPLHPPTVVDPFEGRVLDELALEELAARHTGGAEAPDPRSLEPASGPTILIRMLNNLRGIYAAKQDRAQLRGILERLEVLAPSTELRRQIEALGGGLAPPPRSRPLPLH